MAFNLSAVSFMLRQLYPMPDFVRDFAKLAEAASNGCPQSMRRLAKMLRKCPEREILESMAMGEEDAHGPFGLLVYGSTESKLTDWLPPGMNFQEALL